MRHKHAIAMGMMTLGAIVGTGLAAQADTAPARQPDKSLQQRAFNGYQVIKLPNANVPNFSRRYVYCPAGKRAIGGGGEAQGNDAILVGSFPTDSGNGWIALGRQNAYRNVGISVYVICANVS